VEQGRAACGRARGHPVNVDTLGTAFYALKRRAAAGVDADVRDFFGSVNHDWLFRFLEHRIGSVAPGLPLELEGSPSRFAAHEGKAQESEGLRSADTAFLAVDSTVMPMPAVGRQSEVFD
jgi:hypothetical protein